MVPFRRSEDFVRRVKLSTRGALSTHQEASQAPPQCVYSSNNFPRYQGSTFHQEKSERIITIVTKDVRREFKEVLGFHQDNNRVYIKLRTEIKTYMESHGIRNKTEASNAKWSDLKVWVLEHRYLRPTVERCLREVSKRIARTSRS